MMRNMFNCFDDDLFFTGHRERMGELANSPIPVFTAADGMVERPKGGHGRRDLVMQHPGDMFSDMMSHMQQMMGQMQNGMQMDMRTDGGNGHSYIQSSVYSYRNTGQGQPEVYEAHHSNRYAPGGIREERKALRDSRRQMEKMAVGRHIGERGHVMQKSRNTETDQVEQHQDLIGITEDDVENYKREWEQKTREWSNQHQLRGGGHRRELGGARYDRHEPRALEYTPEPKQRERRLKKTK